MVTQICKVCGKKANTFNSYATEFGNIVLCAQCYTKITTLKKSRKYTSQQELLENRDEVMKELDQLQYPEDVKQNIQYYFNERSEKLKESIANNAIATGQYTDEMANHMLTSGYDFQGYRIVKYIDVVTGESVLGTGIFSTFDADISDLLGVESSAYTSKLQEARNYAKRRAILKSIAIGGNALIGLDIDYVNFTADKMGVIVNGTSVIVEKIEE